MTLIRALTPASGAWRSLEALEGLPVDLDPEPRLPRERHLSVHDLELIADELLPQERVAEVRGQELDEGAVRRHRGEVGAGGDADPRLPAVGDDQATALGGHGGDAAGLGEAADAPDVGLGDVDEADVHQVRELEAGVLPLAGGDADGRLAVRVDRTRGGRRCGSGSRGRRGRAPSSPRRSARRRRGIGPGVLDIDHQRHVGADGAAARGDDLGDLLVGLLEAAVVVGAAQGDLQLRRAEAQGAGAHGPLDEGVAVLVERAPRRLEGSVGDDAVLRLLAEELPAGLPRGLAPDVPKRHVERAMAQITAPRRPFMALPT